MDFIFFRQEWYRAYWKPCPHNTSQMQKEPQMPRWLPHWKGWYFEIFNDWLLFYRAGRVGRRRCLGAILSFWGGVSWPRCPLLGPQVQISTCPHLILTRLLLTAYIPIVDCFAPKGNFAAIELLNICLLKFPRDIWVVWHVSRNEFAVVNVCRVSW